MSLFSLSLGIAPHGKLVIVPDPDAEELDIQLSQRLQDAFARGAGHGLLQLGAGEVHAALPAALAYWRDFGSRFVTAVCAQPQSDAGPRAAITAPADLDALAASAPPMTGAEYLSSAVLADLWQALNTALDRELRESKCDVQEFLKRRDPAWNTVGRVHFNLAENRQDPDAPFAFLATYTTRLSTGSKAQHLPLGQALREYAGAANKDRLLSLLVPVQRASQSCPWLKSMEQAGEIYHPLRWTPPEAIQFLKDVPQLENAGIVIRMPASWSGNRPARPRVSGIVGARPPSGVGQEALLDFKMDVTLDGEPLSEAEIRGLLASTDGLVLLRGRWVEIDREQLGGAIDHFGKVQRAALENGLNFRDAMRLLAGARLTASDDLIADTPDWAQVAAGPWLADMVKGLRNPEGLAKVHPGDALHATLRPYQEAGLRWLYLLTRLGLGACLADDMGLGKTIQVLALLAVLRRESKDGERQPSILVAPASLLANWASELERFTPGLRAIIAHPSALPADELKSLSPERLRENDLVITTYGSLLRLPWIAATRWRLAVLDEAQAIKNSGAQQTRAAKKLNAACRIALTGTPVENRLGDLWSIFDFINPGLLGTGKEFTAFAKKLAQGEHASYAPLRDLARPYILRRLKTDRCVIADLPDKTELKAYCSLSRKQAALYEQAVSELANQIAQVAGIRRKGLVLTYLMRFKQICNHPSQWLGDGSWNPADSGKLARLREIAEVIAAKQEKMLVFTQFRETTAPLSGFLEKTFGSPGLVLHGETEIKKRKDLVRRFQEDDATKFFVLSLKAGGSGLNLTAASHVVHFDRWWNPAVENQATDRAFRIGQLRNVLVHKFVCRGTVEEKIDELIESKSRLSQDVLEGGADLMLTEMQDEDLLRLIALDMNKAMQEV